MLYSYDSQSKRDELLRQPSMLRNCKEDIRFCYDIRGKSYDKYDPSYTFIYLLLIERKYE